jgi:hypothetical protein
VFPTKEPASVDVETLWKSSGGDGVKQEAEIAPRDRILSKVVSEELSN